MTKTMGPRKKKQPVKKRVTVPTPSSSHASSGVEDQGEIVPLQRPVANANLAKKKGAPAPAKRPSVMQSTPIPKKKPKVVKRKLSLIEPRDAPSSSGDDEGPSSSGRGGDAMNSHLFNKRYRPPKSARSIMEIQYYQRSTSLLIPKAPFCRLVHEITVQVTNHNTIRWKGTALEALQEATESYITGFFEDSNLLALHAKRITLLKKDMELAYRIRGDDMRVNR